MCCFIYYVYEWFNVDTNEVFYIGKGKDKRYKIIYNRNQSFQDYYHHNNCDVRIVHNNLSEQEAHEIERQLIAKYRNMNQAKCNICDGGEGLSGYIHTEDTKDLMRQLSKERWEDESYRKKCINSFRNFYQTEEGTRVASNRSKKNMANPKVRDKISQSNIEYFKNDDNRKKHSEIMKRCFNNKATIEAHKKKVVQLDLGNNYINTFDSLMDAEKETGIGFKNISKVLRGTNKRTKGFRWMYYDDYIAL